MALTPIPRYPKAPVKPKPSKAPVGRGTVRTGGSGTSAAQQMVNAALAPILASLKQQETTAGLANLRQQDSLSSFTRGILDYLKGAPAAIQSDYQGAVDQTRNLAQASADQLLKSNPNSLNQADLAAIGAPQEQRDALAAQNQNVYGGGASVLFKTAGAIPATAFAEDKAAASAFANSLPSIQGLAATQAFQRLLAQQGEGMAKFAAQRAEIEGKRPGLLLDAQSQIDKQASASAKAPTVKRIGDAYYQWSGSNWVKVADYAPGDKYGQTTLSNGQHVTTLNGRPIGQPWGPVKKAGAGKAPTTRTFDGKVQQWDPATGNWNPIGRAGGEAIDVQPKTVPQLVKTRGINVLNSSLKNIFLQGFGSGIPKQITVDGKKVTNPAYISAVQKYDAWLASGKSFKTVMARVQNSIGYSLKKAGWSNDQIKQAAYEITATAIAPPKGYTPPEANPKNRKNVSYSGTADFSSLSQGAVGRVGTDLGGPAAHYAKRDSGENWQSNNAWDIGVPIGTPIYALSDGVIGSGIGISSARPKDGSRVTVDGNGNSYYYAHLSDIVVRPGQMVKAGQIIGYSGKSANGAAHLHLGVKHIPGYGQA